MSDPRVVTKGLRVPSHYGRCRWNGCSAFPVADLARAHSFRGRLTERWWAYCATHLRNHGYEMREGEVWRLWG